MFVAQKESGWNAKGEWGTHGAYEVTFIKKRGGSSLRNDVGWVKAVRVVCVDWRHLLVAWPAHIFLSALTASLHTEPCSDFNIPLPSRRIVYVSVCICLRKFSLLCLTICPQLLSRAPLSLFTPTHTILVARPAHNSLIALPASPHTRLVPV